MALVPPDGRQFIYLALGSWRSRDLRGFSGFEPKKRVRSFEDHNSSVIYAEPGLLLYLQDDGLMAQPFDAKRLRKTGEAVLVTRNVPAELTNRALFSVSDNGLLLFSGVDRSRVVLRDRDGKELRSIGPDTRYVGMRLSPNGQKAVYSTRATVSPIPEYGKFRVLDLQSEQQIAYNAAPDQRAASLRFSSDGRQVFFSTGGAVYVNILAEDKARVLIEYDFTFLPLDVSRELLLLLARRQSSTGLKVQLWYARLGAAGKLEDLKPFHRDIFQREGSEILPRRTLGRLHVRRVRPGAGLCPRVPFGASQDSHIERGRQLSGVGKEWP